MVALLVTVVAAAGFVTVVAGIRVSERRAGLPRPARGRADAFARWILAADVQQTAINSRLTATFGQRRSNR